MQVVSDKHENQINTSINSTETQVNLKIAKIYETVSQITEKNKINSILISQDTATAMTRKPLFNKS
jgi:hypothetical protein